MFTECLNHYHRQLFDGVFDLVDPIAKKTLGQLVMRKGELVSAVYNEEQGQRAVNRAYRDYTQRNLFEVVESSGKELKAEKNIHLNYSVVQVKAYESQRLQRELLKHDQKIQTKKILVKKSLDFGTPAQKYLFSKLKDGATLKSLNQTTNLSEEEITALLLALKEKGVVDFIELA